MTNVKWFMTQLIVNFVWHWEQLSDSTSTGSWEEEEGREKGVERKGREERRRGEREGGVERKGREERRRGEREGGVERKGREERRRGEKREG